MSEITDAKRLRNIADLVVEGADRIFLNAIADRLGWGDKPPDTEGDWVLTVGGVYGIHGIRDAKQGRLLHRDGDRWFKLPEDKP